MQQRGKCDNAAHTQRHSAKFDGILKQRNVPLFSRGDYRKWLLYFLNFRAKYPLPDAKPDQVKLFADKLRSKNQNAAQVVQAADAISGTTHVKYDRTSEAALKKESCMVREPPASSTPFPPRLRSGKQYDEWRCLRKSASSAWDKAIALLADEIKTRHYSRKTLKHYADWCRKFQSYLKHKDTAQLSSTDVKSYLTYLAVNCKVASSTQNQAFNALLFLYRHVLKKDFGNHKDIPRAKKSNYIPVILSRTEIDAVLQHL